MAADFVSCLLQSLFDEQSFFDEQVNSMNLSLAERKSNQGLYGRISSPEFLLYLYFLKSQLLKHADISRKLQKKNQTRFATYRRKDLCFYESVCEPRSL